VAFRLFSVRDGRRKHGDHPHTRLAERRDDQPLVRRWLAPELDPRVVRAELLLHEPEKAFESGVHAPRLYLGSVTVKPA
jgi:hypothetical protein